LSGTEQRGGRRFPDRHFKRVTDTQPLPEGLTVAECFRKVRVMPFGIERPRNRLRYVDDLNSGLIRRGRYMRDLGPAGSRCRDARAADERHEPANESSTNTTER
jgi:hypothetical protein